MKNNKKIKVLVLFLALFLIVAGCTRAPMERPREQSVTPQASSTFRKGEVEKVRVIRSTVPIRGGNSTNFPIITSVKKDDILDVAGLAGKWYVVKLNDGRVGTVNPEEVKPVVEKPDLSEQSTNIRGLTPNEQEMLRMVNAERSKQGLNPLEVDLKITELARLKSQDMIDNNYFSHYSPTYGSPFDMMKNHGVKYVYAGENIAGNNSVNAAHQSLMNSEGHRKNILNPNFTHIGIGIREGSKYGKIFTQMFVGR